MAQQIDSQFLRSLIGFINRENTSLPIDAVISLIAKCVYETVNMEIDVKLIQDANLTQFINDSKAGRLTAIPDNMLEAFFTSKLCNYLSIKVQEHIFGDKTASNSNKVAGSFTWNPFQ
jgi:hypothetical protein